MTTIDHPKVRAGHTCVACLGPKGEHTLLCWPCHHAQKAANDGRYCEEIERRLDGYEKALGEGHMWRREKRA